VSRLTRLADPLRHRNFRLLWIGQTGSAVGSVFQSVALAWLVLDVTGSALALSGALLAIAAPGMATTLIGGVLTDRVDPRRVMAWSDGVRAATMVALALVAAGGPSAMTTIYLLLAGCGAAGGVFGPAAAALVSKLAPPGELQSANSLTQASPQLAMIVGAPTAGALIATVGAVPAVLLNAASFAASAAIVLRIGRTGPTRSGPTGSMLAAAREGVSFVLEQRWLLTLLVVDAFLGLAAIGPLAVGLPLLARQNPQFGAAGLGLLLLGFGSGSLAGMIYVGTRPTPTRPGRHFCLLNLPQGLLLLAAATTPLPVAVAALALLGALSGIAVVGYLLLIQRNVPDALMGRVMSRVGLVSFGLVPLSQAVSGLIADRVGALGLFTAAATVMTLASLAGLASRPLRDTASHCPTRHPQALTTGR
jgi:MFS transporter, DHA3 family, tetracycline resistance protein